MGAPAAGPPVEDAVFVTERPHRRVLVRTLVIGGSALLVAWLAALVVGSLGFSTLPSLSFAGGHGDPVAAGQRGDKGTKNPARGSKPASASGRTILVASSQPASSASGSSSTTGGRGTATVNPAGRAPGGNAHGANPNAA